MYKLLTHQISDEKQKTSFSDIRDWETNFKALECGDHHKKPKLNLFINKNGSGVTVNTCCEDFFHRIVAKKLLMIAK